MRQAYPAVELFGLSFFGGGMDDLLQIITEHLSLEKNVKPLTIFTPNPEQIVLADHDHTFRQDLQWADLRIPDGGGLVTANRLRGMVPFLFERIPGVEVVRQILALENVEQLPILVIGGREYNHKKVEGGWQVHEEGGLTPKTIHWTSGYANVNAPTAEEELALEQKMKKLQPAIVFVAFGAPAQERFIHQHFDLFFNNKARLIMAVGGSFDSLTGKLKRAPAFVQQLGFEWLFRLIQEPSRWKRQLRLIEFGWLTWKVLWSDFRGKP